MTVHRGSGPGSPEVGASSRSSHSSRASIEAAVARNAAWYHTLELADGVLTPGQIDLREVAPKLLPADLAGKRVLDIGTFDGFWAFELEQRGAEVVAIDLGQLSDTQIPPNNREQVEQEAELFGVELGLGFEIASAARESTVRRVVCDVLDLTPEAIGGPVDLAFMGALLVHLRDPVHALERIRATLAPGGELYQLETVSLPLSLLHPRAPVARFHPLDTGYNWWFANSAALRAWLSTAGFVEIRGRGWHHPPQRRPMNDWYRGIVSRAPA